MRETGKLIRWGSSETLIISLPRKWVKANNLSAEQFIKIQTNGDGSITLIPENLKIRDKDLETIVKIKDVDDIENIRLRILTKYLDGWDVIKLEVGTGTKTEFPTNIEEKIEEIIEPLLGLQILGINPKEILIKNLMSVEGSNVMNLIKLVSDQTISLGKILIGHIEEHEDFSEKTGRTEWKNIKKYHYQITREQRKALLHPASLVSMKLTLQDLVDFQFYLMAVYNIAEIIKYIIDTGKKYSFQGDEFGITSFFKTVINLVEDSIDSFLFKETNKAVEVMKIIKKQKPHKRDIENKVDGAKEHFHMFQVILDMAEKIMDYNEDVCLAALRRAI